MNLVTELLQLIALAERTAEQDARVTEIYGLLDDAQLAELETAAMARFQEVRTSETPDLPELERLADVVDNARAGAAQRYEAAETAAAEAAAAEQARLDAIAALDARLTPAPVEEPTVETEAVTETAEEPVPVAADGAPASAPAAPASPPAPAPASRQAIAGRAPAAVAPAPELAPRVTITAAGGGEFENRVDVENALLDRVDGLSGTDQRGRFRVASFRTAYPEDRRLRPGRVTDMSEVQAEILARVHEPGGTQALVADGGICGPLENVYDTVTVAQAGRPLRDGLTAFDAGRGGISFPTPLSLDDILAATTPTTGNAIGVVTEAQDAAGSVNKSFQVVECADFVECRVDAVYMQLKFGNFYDRTNPEGKAQFTDLSLAKFARFAEQRLWAKMLGLADTHPVGQTLGSSRDVINGVNRWAVNYRGRHRMAPDAVLDVYVPAWLFRGVLPDDQVNAQQAYPEQFSANAAWVAARLAERNVRVAALYEDDWTTGSADGAALAAYPTTAHIIGAHPGNFVYVDSGVLDLGVIRDSTLVADNTFITFTEEFFNVCQWGVGSDDLVFDTCPSGASSAPIDVDCPAGS